MYQLLIVIYPSVSAPKSTAIFSALSLIAVKIDPTANNINHLECKTENQYQSRIANAIGCAPSDLTASQIQSDL